MHFKDILLKEYSCICYQSFNLYFHDLESLRTKIDFVFQEMKQKEKSKIENKETKSKLIIYYYCILIDFFPFTYSNDQRRLICSVEFIQDDKSFISLIEIVSQLIVKLNQTSLRIFLYCDYSNE